MSERGLAPYPQTEDLRSWAIQLVEFLNNQARSEEFVSPRVVSLLHQIPPAVYRALNDGLLMYDPVLGVPVYSEGGQWKQFTSQGNLNYLTTDDAGDGTVADDINNTDFTGQQGAVGACAQCPVNVEVAFFHKGVQYLYTGPTPASYGLGCADTMQGDFLIPVGVGTFLALADTPDSYENFANYWPRVSPNEGELVFDQIEEADITNLDRMRWRGNWVDGNTYLRNDVSLDWPWLAVANKTTTDRPAPLDVGDPFFVYTGAAPTSSLAAKTLLVGNTYTLPVTLKVPTVRVYTITGNFYSVYLKDIATGQITTLRSFEATVTDWVEIAGPGNVLAAGTQFEVALYVTEPDPTPTNFNGNWNYQTPNNAGVPASGQISHADRLLSSFRVHKTDNDGGDRSAELATMTVGDTIEGGGTRWSISAITDNGTWIDFEVAPQQQVTDGIQNFTFETVTATPITVVADIDFYLGNADIRPFYSIDGGVRVLTDNAYNVDIEVQEITVSDDWDLMANSQGSGGSGGGGGGASTFTELADTPPSYAGQAGKSLLVAQGEDGLEFGPAGGATVGDTFPASPGEGALHYLTVEPVGLYVWYNDGDSLQWVQTNGGAAQAPDPAPADPFADYEWIDESANRSLNTEYINNTGYSIQVSVSRISSVDGVLRQAGLTAIVDGVTLGSQSYIDRNNANGHVQIGGIAVPPGSTYQFTSSVGSTTVWAEFRKKVT